MFNESDELNKLERLLNKSVREYELVERNKKLAKEKEIARKKRIEKDANKKTIPIESIEVKQIEVIQWDTKLYLAIIEVQYCSNCWNESSSIIGYYAIQTNEKLKVNRLNGVKLKDCSNLKYHRISKKVDACVNCLQAEYYDSVDLMEYLDLIKTF